MTGKIEAISTSAEKGVPKDNVDSARLVENWGVEGDAHAGNWHRQISLLAVESVDKMRKNGLDLRPGIFGENITCSGLPVQQLHVGERLRVGDAELEITQLGKDCHDRCAIFEAVGDCVMPREGIFGRVIRGGTIRVGDTIQVTKNGESK